MSEYGLLVKNQYGNIHSDVFAETPTIIQVGYATIGASGSAYGNIGTLSKNAFGFYHATAYASPAIKWYGNGYVRIYQRYWKVTSTIYFIIGQYGPGQIVPANPFGIRDNNIFQSKSVTSDLHHLQIRHVTGFPTYWNTTAGPFDGFLWGGSAAFNYFYIPFIDFNPGVFVDLTDTVVGVNRRIQVAHIWRNNSTALDFGLYATIEEDWTLQGGSIDVLFTFIEGIPGIYGG